MSILPQAKVKVKANEKEKRWHNTETYYQRKNHTASCNRQIYFCGHPNANKIEIARAVKELIAVLYPKNKCQVTAVNTLLFGTYTS